jgi:2-dehydropantoate 2-reductase
LRECGIKARANGCIVDIVKQVERSELEPDPRHISDLRPN